MAETAERRASWLELFYDLVFVIAVSKVASHLDHDVSPRGFLVFAGLFLVMLWSWSGFAAYSSRYELDDRFHRLVTLAQMLAAAALAVQMPEVPGGGETGFVVAYLGLRVALIALYVRIRPRFPEIRQMNTLLVTGYGAAALVWLVSLLVPAPIRYGVWLAGLALDMGVPAWGARHLRTQPADTALMPERYGLFTLIVLGESIFAVISNLGQQHWQPVGVAAALMGFGLAAAVWWSYFNYVERAPLQCSLGTGQLYAYIHLPLIFGLTTAGVGVGRTIRQAEATALDPGTLVALLGGLAVFLGSFLVLQVTTYPRELGSRLKRTYGPVLAALGVLAVASPAWPPLAVLTAVTVCVAILAAMDVRWRVAVPARAYRLAAEDPRDQPVLKRYHAPDVEVSFDPALCIHSGECLRRLPDVFDVRSRPWVRADRAAPETVVEVVHHCPSGALKILRGPVVEEPEASGAQITLVPGGPALIEDDDGVRVSGGPTPPTGNQVALCRCGRSQRFPYCDGSHEG